jgi:ADP-ribosylglycohydrolase
MDRSEEARLARALVSLEGLSVGDAFGERFFVSPDVARLIIGERGLAPPPWRYTDDTQMALSLVETLRQCDAIAQSTSPVASAGTMTSRAATARRCTSCWF